MREKIIDGPQVPEDMAKKELQTEVVGITLKERRHNYSLRQILQVRLGSCESDKFPFDYLYLQFSEKAMAPHSSTLAWFL